MEAISHFSSFVGEGGGGGRALLCFSGQIRNILAALEQNLKRNVARGTNTSFLEHNV